MEVTSLAWSPVRVSGGTQLFDEKMNVNFGATLDPRYRQFWKPVEPFQYVMVEVYLG
jgi:hypothetical protein